MIEPKFTHGPWIVYPEHNIMGQKYFSVSYGDDDGLICEFICHEEDAKLIAAAPKMYNVLNDILHGGFCADKFKAIHEVLCEARGESTESRCGSCKFFKSKISACVFRKERPFYVKEETIPCLEYEPRNESENQK